MLSKRIIPCLDVRDGHVVKGVRFEDVKDVSSPVELAKYYSDNGADELAFYDITASNEGRRLFTELLSEVAEQIKIPLIAGGGIKSLDDIERVLKCGADKVSINTGAILIPELISAASEKYGRERIVLSADVRRADGRFMVFTRGGRVNTGIDAIEWLKKCEQLGAGEIVLNSIDTDGVKEGYDLEMLEAACEAVSLPVIASGGAGSIDDFLRLFKAVPKVDAALAASVFHFGDVKIPELKSRLNAGSIPLRL